MIGPNGCELNIYWNELYFDDKTSCYYISFHLTWFQFIFISVYFHYLYFVFWWLFRRILSRHAGPVCYLPRKMHECCHTADQSPKTASWPVECMYSVGQHLMNLAQPVAKVCSQSFTRSNTQPLLLSRGNTPQVILSASPQFNPVTPTES